MSPCKKEKVNYTIILFMVCQKDVQKIVSAWSCEIPTVKFDENHHNFSAQCLGAFLTGSDQLSINCIILSLFLGL